jgi:decaprenylphospho-beta-D-erythro-pentofuranosid-2-ulose 2-reductase
MNKKDLKVWSIGATSKIAIELQRLWAAEGADLYLVSREPLDLKPIVSDLKIRGACKVEVHGLNDAKNAFETGEMDILLISLGSLSDQGKWEDSQKYRELEWTTNTSLVIDWLELGASKIEKEGRGQLCVITSVAADRAKKSNYGYGAAKAALDFYAEGVAHRLSPISPCVTVLKPGPTDTPMTANLNGKKLADPKQVATIFKKAIESKKAISYAPWQWKYIMLIIKYLPRKIWFKTNF